jgi:hypothetical protein
MVVIALWVRGLFLVLVNTYAYPFYGFAFEDGLRSFAMLGFLNLAEARKCNMLML